MGCCYSRQKDEDTPPPKRTTKYFQTALEDENVPPIVPKRTTEHSHKPKPAKELISSDIDLESSYQSCSTYGITVYNFFDVTLNSHSDLNDIREPSLKLQYPTIGTICASDPMQFVDFTDRDEEAEPNINIYPDAPPPPVLPL